MTRATRCAAVAALAGTALAAAGCGSSGSSTPNTSATATAATSTATTSTATTSTATTTATTPEAGATIEGDSVAHLPKVPAATEPGRLAGPTEAAGERAFLSAVFHDAEPMWTREFAAAGLHYTPAQFTIFQNEVHQQDPGGTNARSVRLELQADCFAGIWKHATYQRGQLEDKNFEDALRAAAVVGDDFQQRNATGTISPEDWTHGSSQQRQQWLTTGFEQGEPAACDTFGS
jgi:predicted metalloprotease